MARPKEFDVDTALESALGVFWEKGFEATSIQDLVAAMGINKASLYGTYGDKNALYLAALRRYQDVRLGLIAAEFENSPSARDAIAKWLSDTAKRATGPDRDRGCFCVNASNEMSMRDAAVGAQMQAHGRRIEALIAKTLERARSEGALPKSADPKRLSTYFYSLALALNVLGKQHASKDRLQAVVDQGLAVFGG